MRVTFTIVAVVGALTLLTDLWRAEQWPVPRGNLLTPALWQAFLGALFLLTFLIWAWFAFIRPTRYGAHNAERFAQTLYRFVLTGSPTELAVVADELTASIRVLLRNAIALKESKRQMDIQGNTNPVFKRVESYANDLLLLIADKRFCRAIVESSPITALTIFQGIAELKKYDIPIGIFAKNILNSAINYSDSFLYHETEVHSSGLIGHHKPLSQAMFSNYKMVEAIGSMLDTDYAQSSKWEASQWEAYSRAVLITFRSYIEEGNAEHSFVLYRSMDTIQNIATDVHKLNGVANIAWDDDALARMRVAVDFICDAVEILDKKGVPANIHLRLLKKKTNSFRNESIFDGIAKMIFEVVFSASAVSSPRSECWWVQHNTVWGELFEISKLSNKAGRIVQFKVRRLLYDEILRMNEFPNFKGARILGLCLNVMGLHVGKGDFGRESRALQRAVLSWTRRHFAEIHQANPKVAEACLVDGWTYEADKLRLLRVTPADGLRRKPHYVYFRVDPAHPNNPSRN